MSHGQTGRYCWPVCAQRVKRGTSSGLVNATLAITLCLVAAACESPGKGPLTLSKEVSDFVQTRMVLPGKAYVSEDGKHLVQNFCPAERCVGGAPAQSKCEQQSGVKCHLFSDFGRIVWDGPIAFAKYESIARFRAPMIGTRILTDKGPIKIDRVHGMKIVTVDAAGRSTIWTAGIFQFDQRGSIAERGSDRTNDPADAWRNDANVKYMLDEKRGPITWHHEIAYLGKDSIVVDGRSYAIEKFARKITTSGLMASGEQVRETLWFAPDVGFLLRYDVEQLGGAPIGRSSFKATKVELP